VNKSESITNLAKSLTAFQKCVKNPANTADNPFYKSKYAPLSDILNLVRPLLSDCGLSVLQSPGGNGDSISVTTLLLHDSGEWIESDPVVTKAEKTTAQGAGSAITYLRRYSLSAVLGISSEDDDDGNGMEGTDTTKYNTGRENTGSQGKTTQAIDKPATGQNNKPDDIADKATEAQCNAINNISKKKNIGYEVLQAIIQESYKKTEVKALTKKEASEIITYLNNQQ
jgi:hypothetical protein